MYASKIAKKLEQNAKTLRGELETATKMYDSGVKAYGRGMYDDAVKWFKAAAETSETSLLGGRIQIYLALSLDAYGQRDKALDIYAYLESVHPEKSIRKQAEELRFILEAPRMEIGENERVDVPLLRDPDAFAPYSNKWSTASSSSGSGARAKREKTLQQEYGSCAGRGSWSRDKLRLDPNRRRRRHRRRSRLLFDHRSMTHACNVYAQRYCKSTSFVRRLRKYTF